MPARPVTRRQRARDRLQVAFHALDDVARAQANDPDGRIVPAGAVDHVSQARSHVRAALQEYDHPSPPNHP